MKTLVPNRYYLAYAAKVLHALDRVEAAIGTPDPKALPTVADWLAEISRYDPPPSISGLPNQELAAMLDEEIARRRDPEQTDAMGSSFNADTIREIFGPDPATATYPPAGIEHQDGDYYIPKDQLNATVSRLAALPEYERPMAVIVVAQRSAGTSIEVATTDYEWLRNGDLYVYNVDMRGGPIEVTAVDPADEATPRPELRGIITEIKRWRRRLPS